MNKLTSELCWRNCRNRSCSCRIDTVLDGTLSGEHQFRYSRLLESFLHILRVNANFSCCINKYIWRSQSWSNLFCTSSSCLLFWRIEVARSLPCHTVRQIVSRPRWALLADHANSRIVVIFCSVLEGVFAKLILHVTNPLSNTHINLSERIQMFKYTNKCSKKFTDSRQHTAHSTQHTAHSTQQQHYTSHITQSHNHTTHMMRSTDRPGPSRRSTPNNYAGVTRVDFSVRATARRTDRSCRMLRRSHSLSSLQPASLRMASQLIIPLLSPSPLCSHRRDIKLPESKIGRFKVITSIWRKAPIGEKR